MGYQLKNVCYDTQQNAIDAYFLGQSINFNVSDNSTDIFYFQKYQNQWSACKQSFSSSSPSCIQLDNPVFSTCEYSSDPTSQFQAGMELGWLVAGTVVIAFLLRFLRVRF